MAQSFEKKLLTRGFFLGAFVYCISVENGVESSCTEETDRSCLTIGNHGVIRRKALAPPL